MMDRTYRVNDVVKSEFLRMPLTLLANPKYKQMSLEAKFIYSLLLNRMTLSQRNDWINEDNEVYLIYTREEAANTLNISYKKSIAAFKELIRNGLLYEQRQGLGAPNLLYVLKAELTDEDASEFSKDFDGKPAETDEKERETSVNMQTCQNGISRHAKTAHQDMPKSHIKNCQNGISGTAETTSQDMPKQHASNIDNKKTDMSYIENSQSINQSSADSLGRIAPAIMTDGQTDDEEMLQDILDSCELHMFRRNIRTMLVQVIERLYYSESLRIGNARLPQAKVRSCLRLLDACVLMSVLNTMKENEERIINPMAYLMSTIINTVCEQESSLILGLPPQYQSSEDFYIAPGECEEGDDKDGKLFEDGSTTDLGDIRYLWSSS